MDNDDLFKRSDILEGQSNELLSLYDYLEAHNEWTKNDLMKYMLTRNETIKTELESIQAEMKLRLKK